MATYPAIFPGDEALVRLKYTKADLSNLENGIFLTGTKDGKVSLPLMRIEKVLPKQWEVGDDCVYTMLSMNDTMQRIPCAIHAMDSEKAWIKDKETGGKKVSCFVMLQFLHR